MEKNKERIIFTLVSKNLTKSKKVKSIQKKTNKEKRNFVVKKINHVSNVYLTEIFFSCFPFSSSSSSSIVQFNQSFSSSLKIDKRMGRKKIIKFFFLIQLNLVDGFEELNPEWFQ